MTAAWSSPSRSTASSVPNSGTPRMKLWVPSIGSMYQRTDASPASRAVLLADEAVVRERRRGCRSRISALDRRVGLGHERPVGLGLDLEVAPEVPPGDRVGLVAGGQGDVQPAAQLGVRARAGTRPTSPRPKRGRRVAHARILAPARGRTAARARPRSRSSRRTPRPRRASRWPPDPAAGRRTRSSARRRTRSRPSVTRPTIVAADAHRLVAEADRARVVEDEAAQPLRAARPPSRPRARRGR